MKYGGSPNWGPLWAPMQYPDWGIRPQGTPCNFPDWGHPPPARERWACYTCPCNTQIGEFVFSASYKNLLINIVKKIKYHY